MPANLVQPQFVEWLSNDSGFNLHLTVLSLLLLGGFGFPIPEDIPLILAGVAAQKGLVLMKAVLVTCYVGVLSADIIVYGIGYCFGQKLLKAGTRSSLFPSITEQRVMRIREGLRKKRLTYIFIGRHLFPVRTATFISAGALHIPFFEFLAADAFAALVSVTLVVSIGHLLGGQLTPEIIRDLLHRSHYYIVILTILVVGFLGGRYYFRRKRRIREHGHSGAYHAVSVVSGSDAGASAGESSVPSESAPSEDAAAAESKSGRGRP